MKSNYFKLYYFDSLITLALYIVIYLTTNNEFYESYDFLDINLFSIILLVINIIILFINVYYDIKKYKFNIKDNKFPKLYIIFLISAIVISLLINKNLVLKGIAFSYYYGFVLFNYLLLNIYTLLSYEIKKNK